MGKLVRAITLIPSRYFDDNWYAYISGQDDVLRAIMVTPPCHYLELSPLNELYKGKLIHLSFEIIK